MQPSNPDSSSGGQSDKRVKDPLDTFGEIGDMLDLDLDGEDLFATAADRSGATVTTHGVISTGHLQSIESDEETTRHIKPSSKSGGTTMDGGKFADNLALEGSRRYRLRRELGAGGMATVYDAVDLDLRRHVALKVLHDEHLKKAEDSSETGDRSVLQRFIEEAQITGQLEHPNIVPVHEIGRDQNGRMYFAMKRVEGSSLAEIMDRMREGDSETLNRYGVLTCARYSSRCAQPSRLPTAAMSFTAT